VLEVNTRRALSKAEREADLAESLAFARTHLGPADGQAVAGPDAARAGTTGSGAAG
jgi:hypothetical protein